MLRRVEYGDFDLIVTLFTVDVGKVAVMAKAAKKSTKRFAGILEIFSILDVVYARGKGRTSGLPYLKEASLKRPFFNIRSDVVKTGYASYWVELINLWMEEGVSHRELFHLLEAVLVRLDQGDVSAEILSLVFQLRFLHFAGLEPALDSCTACRRRVAEMRERSFEISISKGGLVCAACSPDVIGKHSLSRGTLMQLRWLLRGDLDKAFRMRLSPWEARQGLAFLERFVCFHLGKEPKSLKFLRSLRDP
jgi:DNA repair protein RecO (recombination protein O)